MVLLNMVGFLNNDYAVYLSYAASHAYLKAVIAIFAHLWKK